jgi:hypothetical protein
MRCTDILPYLLSQGPSNEPMSAKFINNLLRCELLGAMLVDV